MKLEMKDTPGQLVAALKPISEVGGNIIAVIHQRDEKKDGDTLSVQIVLEIQEQRLGDLITLIKAQGVSILRIGKEHLLYKQTVIMIGHLMHTDLGDTIDKIDCTGFAEVIGHLCTGFAEVTDLHIAMPAINERSSARLEIKAANEESMEQAVNILRDVAREKKLLIIEPLEECP